MKNLLITLILLSGLSLISYSLKQETIEVKIKVIHTINNEPRKNIKNIFRTL